MAIEKLAALYRSKRYRRLEADPERGTLLVEKGSLIVSTIVIGPETWCRHTIEIAATQLTSSETQLEFELNLKLLLGLTVGKNFLIEECKKALASMGTGKWT